MFVERHDRRWRYDVVPEWMERRSRWRYSRAGAGPVRFRVHYYGMGDLVRRFKPTVRVRKADDGVDEPSVPCDVCGVEAVNAFGYCAYCGADPKARRKAAHETYERLILAAKSAPRWRPTDLLFAACTQSDGRYHAVVTRADRALCGAERQTTEDWILGDGVTCLPCQWRLMRR